MKHHTRRTCGILFLMAVAWQTWGADLDDGIALDTPVDDSLRTGLNVPFILMKVKARELRAKKKGEDSKTLITDDGANSSGQGNIIFGPGAKLAPGTVIINKSDNRGATAIAK